VNAVSDRDRIRALVQEVIRLLDLATQAHPALRPRTLAAVRLLTTVVKALPTPALTDEDLHVDFQGLDDGDGGTGNPIARNAE